MNIASKIVYGSWSSGASVCYLVIKSNQKFRAVDGEIVQPGIYRIVPCVVTGRDITIPLIANIPTTTDSSDPAATWTAYFENANHSTKMDWLSGFQLDHVLTSPTRWELIYDDNNPPGIPLSPEAISYQQAVLLVERKIAEITPTVLASGIGTLPIDDILTVLDSHVAADSPIRLIAKTEDITGTLRAFNRVAGVSFDVSSDNAGDNGNFRWEICP